MFHLDMAQNSLLTDDQKEIAKRAGQVATGGAVVVGSTQAFAFDTTETGAIKTEIDNTKDDATNVGNYIIGLVLLLALFGVIIAMLHKR